MWPYLALLLSSFFAILLCLGFTGYRDNPEYQRYNIYFLLGISYFLLVFLILGLATVRIKIQVLDRGDIVENVQLEQERIANTNLNNNQRNQPISSLRKSLTKNTEKQNTSGKSNFTDLFQINGNLFGRSSDKKKDVAQMMKENKDNDSACFICFDKLPNTVLLPCLHAGVCSDCMEMVLKRKKNCPYCRVALRQVVVFKKENGRLTKVKDLIK